VSFDLRQRADGSIGLEVFVKPRSSKSRVAGARDGLVEVALAAPPVDGAANDELIRTLARVIGIGRSSLRIVAGERSRTKLLAITGVTVEVLRARLDAALRD
jgi:uncharacterized protein (TIGR00251 family)